ncbi:Hypothetical protein MexAM1_META2p0108 (plasmid) [Methylorubrum extorquens AM1]|uniref:Uncharacterized protein n=1 Tax=Methylorubrum extorquens (strain ATCC 14718 / DSM 1338 / JCM 2805 / NCIMB 9133 / AM1) TaxID=272630 RepID=C5B3K5_METEA|nr:Hypothetical protein MexAM1_META2p0108 [Methylorubrum extorquens AM1]
MAGQAAPVCASSQSAGPRPESAAASPCSGSEAMLTFLRPALALTALPLAACVPTAAPDRLGRHDGHGPLPHARHEHARHGRQARHGRAVMGRPCNRTSPDNEPAPKGRRQ